MPSGESDDYLFDSSTDLGQEQLKCLELLFDDYTAENLEPLVRPGHRCLEIGAGSGSIARTLVQRAGPSGHVIALDLENGAMEPVPGLDLRQHDITKSVPDGGPFDLIHARLVLLHLPQRREIVSALADALAPGGWLVIGEFAGPPVHVVESPSPTDTALFQRVLDTAFAEAGRLGGISTSWATEVDACLMHTGLSSVESRRYGRTCAGGSPGCLLFRNYIRQMEPMLGGAGLSRAELHRYYRLMDDPAFRAWFFDLVVTRGQRAGD